MAPAKQPRGLLIGAPASGCGKTTLTLGLIRALKLAGHNVVSAKAGPDYIDPKFHHAASSKFCLNLDPWAMSHHTINALARHVASSGDLFIVEGMMGLFDAARDGNGSSADLAGLLGLPVILVLDASSQSHSIAAVVEGFAGHRENCNIAGLILNRVGSGSHEKMLRDALAPLDIPVIGAVARDNIFSLPSRHLGLVQAGEHEDLEAFITGVAAHVGAHLDLDQLVELAQPMVFAAPVAISPCLPPLGQRIAVARDIAFEFIYPHLLHGWREAGAEISFFSPLANEAPAANSDAVFMPGGYPELHAGRLSGNQIFLDGLRQGADANTLIYGECGGYMVLGEVLTDAKGVDHPMAGLLPVTTSFAARKLHLGYAKLTPALAGSPWAQPLSAHEFHYANITAQSQKDTLFTAVDATGKCIGTMGHKCGSVMGSFAHIIDYFPEAPSR